MSFKEPLAGLMAMSTYVPDENTVRQSTVARDLAIHIFHGDQDKVVPEALGLSAKQLLEDNGYSPQYSQYAMDHSVCHSEIRDIAKFINDCLGQS
jgi:phospholipase/carboxylesterase